MGHNTQEVMPVVRATAIRRKDAMAGYVVESHEQLEAVSSPARRELIDAVQLLGSCSIAEIAEVLGKPADSLYYHVRVLLKVGLLKQVGIRKGSRRDEALYDLPGRPLRFRFDPKDEMSAKLLIDSAGASLRLTERNLKSAVNSKRGTYSGPQRSVFCTRLRRPLSEAELESVNEHLNAIEEILNRPVDEQAASDGEIYAVTLAMTPIDAQPVNRRSAVEVIESK
ncbi:MAG: helix-turn-helix domain-containing protein [Planctomycetota bacterium]